MKLYLAKGTIWCGTQADAKAAQGGAGYEQVEVPTDKGGLIDWLNANWSIGEPAAHDHDAPIGEDEHDDIVHEEPEARPTPAARASAAGVEPWAKHIPMEHRGNGYCARCGRTEQGYKWLAAGNTIDGIREAVYTLDERWQLNAVMDSVEERGEALGFALPPEE